MGKNKDNMWDNINSLWKAVESLQQKLPTTVEPIQTAPTTGNPSDVEEHMFQPTRAYSQWDPVDTKNGPVEHNSECVHQWEYSDYDNLPRHPKNNWGRNWCMICGALWQSGKIVVPAAVTTSSTSVKQPSKESVGNSVEESVKSALNGLIKSFDGLRDFTPVTEKHNGYIEGIVTAQGWIEMKLRELERAN